MAGLNVPARVPRPQCRVARGSSGRTSPDSTAQGQPTRANSGVLGNRNRKVGHGVPAAVPSGRLVVNPRCNPFVVEAAKLDRLPRYENLGAPAITTPTDADKGGSAPTSLPAESSCAAGSRAGCAAPSSPVCHLLLRGGPAQVPSLVVPVVVDPVDPVIGRRRVADLVHKVLEADLALDPAPAVVPVVGVAWIVAAIPCIRPGRLFLRVLRRSVHRFSPSFLIDHRIPTLAVEKRELRSTQNPTKNANRAQRTSCARTHNR
jgi:hypothetical protein